MIESLFTLSAVMARHRQEPFGSYIVIALWLGHDGIETVHVYVEADLAAKVRILAKTASPEVSAKRFRPDDALLAFIKDL